MFCPNCGNKIETGQSFCRTCGVELGKSLQILTTNGSKAIEKTDWLKRMGLFSLGAIGGIGVATLFVFLIAGILRLSQEFGLFSFMILSVIIWGVIAVMFFEKYKPKNKRPQESEDKSADKEGYLPPYRAELWKTNRQLKESTFEPIPTVTEHTTELFYSERGRPKTSGELG